jgi:hypothetical protein
MPKPKSKVPKKILIAMSIMVFLALAINVNALCSGETISCDMLNNEQCDGTDGCTWGVYTGEQNDCEQIDVWCEADTSRWTGGKEECCIEFDCEYEDENCTGTAEFDCSYFNSNGEILTPLNLSETLTNCTYTDVCSGDYTFDTNSGNLFMAFVPIFIFLALILSMLVGLGYKEMITDNILYIIIAVIALLLLGLISC